MSQVLKVQDSIPICAAQLSQLVAAAALGGDGEEGEEGDAEGALFGRAYVRRRVAELEAGNRRAVRAALAAALGEDRVKGGEGAIYFFARLPDEFESRDDDAVRWLVARAGVCVLPGSACAAPGWLRVAFASLPAGPCAAAAARLREGLAELVKRGVAALDDLESLKRQL